MSILFGGGQVTETSSAGWTPTLYDLAVNSAGEFVTPDTMLKLSAAYACVRVISEDVSKLPIKVYRKTGSGKQELPEHPLADLLAIQPNEHDNPLEFWARIVGDACRWHGGFAFIRRDGRNEPLALDYIHPSRIQAVEKSTPLRWSIRGSDGGSDAVVLDTDIFRINGFGSGLNGWSLTQLASEILGLGIAAQRFQSSFYGNGMHVNIAIKHPAKLKEDAYRHLRDSWRTMHGGAAKAFTPAVLEEGMDIVKLSVSPQEAQNIESRQFQVEEVCRFYRVNPNKIQHWLRTTFSNVVESNIDHVGDTIVPWSLRIRQEAQRKLIDREVEPDVFLEHVYTALLRGNPDSRSNFYQKLWQMGALSPDEIRELENMNPIPGGYGKQYFIQSGFVPLDQPDLYAKAPSEPESPSTESTDSMPMESTDAEDSPDVPATEQINQAMSRVFIAQAERLSRKIHKAHATAMQRYGDDPQSYRTWLGDFYNSFQRDLIDAFEAPTLAYAEMFEYPLSANTADRLRANLRAECAAYCEHASQTTDSHMNIYHVASALQLTESMS